MKAFGWLLRREIWEHRGFYLVPSILVTVLVVLYAAVWLSPGIAVSFDIDGHSGTIGDIRQFLLNDPAGRHYLAIGLNALPFVIPMVLINAVTLLLWFAYLSGALYGERRDRSVLFWKSLPVTDTATVLSKFITASLVIPAFALSAILIAALLISVVNTLIVWTAGHSAWSLIWSELPFGVATVILGYGFIAQSLWYAPLFGWLLLASAIAPRAPALWAIVPPLAIALLERLLVGSQRFGTMLGERLQPVVPAAFRDSDFETAVQAGRDSDRMDWSALIGAMIDPQSLVSDPRVWAGILVAAAFLAAAIWLRRYRDAS